MRLGLLREHAPGERRVALVPETVTALHEGGIDVIVEADAGSGSGFGDDAYILAGAKVSSRSDVGTAEVVVGVRGTNASQELGSPKPASGATHVAVFDPLWSPIVAERLAANGVSGFSLDLVPRITRAQSMDVLSSMATISGYEAVILAASRLPKLFPMMMTAAGTLAPARVLVIGAGVAGLQAVATARRLGAVVEAYDVRPAAAEQIRSLGARSVVLDLDGADTEDSGGYARAQSADTGARQQDLLAPHVADADVVITTAAIPGQASPLLLTREMIEAMRPGSVVIDLAAERGGNTAVTLADQDVSVGECTVLGPTDLASRAPRHASQMFSNNVSALLDHLIVDGDITIELDDEVTAAMLVSHGGSVVHPAVIESLERARSDGTT